VPEVRVDGDRVRFGERLAVSFHRTLRVPDDGGTYPLPAGLGRFPIVPLPDGGGAAAHAVPMHPREAMWIGLSGAAWKPNAVKILVGGINAVSGAPDDDGPPRAPQDYLVCPPQPWLDGFNAGDGAIRQFVAMRLGAGYAVEAGHGLPERGGVTVLAFEPVPGRFPDAPPPPGRGPVRFDLPRPPEVHQMAFGAGGRVRQKIYADPHGPDAWDPTSGLRFEVALVDAGWLAAGLSAPPFPTPIDASTYAAAGLPWFELDDAASCRVDPAGGAPPRTIGDVDADRENPH
jgi:hypothetical protein